MSYIALGVGTLVVLGLFALAGRLAGFSVMILWSAGTAYFLMPPVYSFRIANAGDLAAIALYGAVGLVLARTAPGPRRPVRNEHDIPGTESPRAALVNLATVLADLISSSSLGERLKERQVEIDAPYLHKIHCSYTDGVCILSHALAAVLAEPHRCRVSFHVGRRPEAELLFVDVHRVWPPPPRQTITIGKSDENCSRGDPHGWPSHLSATWFDNGYGRNYQITLRRDGHKA
jgi:hypothetical protein